MKKYSYLLVAMMMATLSLGLTACGDDNDEPDGGDNDYFEVTIDGNTKKVESPKGFDIYLDAGKDKSGKEMTFFNAAGLSLGRIGTVEMPIAVYTFKSDFNMKTGTYSFRPITNAGEEIIDDWWNFIYEDDDVKKTFETAMCLTTTDYTDYYSSNGTLNVKSIKKCQVTFQGIKAEGYTIEATFSCKLVKEKDKSNTKECTGRFRLTYFPEDD